MSGIDRLGTIEESLARSISGDAWYGPSLESLLADVTPEGEVGGVDESSGPC